VIVCSYLAESYSVAETAEIIQHPVDFVEQNKKEVFNKVLLEKIVADYEPLVL